MCVIDLVFSELPFVGIVESVGGKEDPGGEDPSLHEVEIKTLKKSLGGFDDERRQYIVRHPRLLHLIFS